MLGIELGALSLLGKHYTTWVLPSVQIYLFMYFCSTGVWPQGFTLAK
jgi:hypothetical protein